MATPLFELYAKLGLDTTDFEQKATAASNAGDTVAQSVADAFSGVDTQASNAESSLNDLEEKSTATQAILKGFLDVTDDLVKDLIEGIIDFGKESIEAAAGTGSELADSFNDAKSAFDVNLEGLKVAVGEGLLPIATELMEAFNYIFDIGDDRKLFSSLSKLEAYSFENLEKAKGDLAGIFGTFENVEYAESESADDMFQALSEQITYWQEYSKTLEELKARGVDASFLNELADGSAESLEKMRALNAADNVQLDQILTAYGNVQSTRESVAQGISDLQLSVDEDFAAMKSDIEDLVLGMDQHVAAQANAALTAQGVVDGLASAYPSISEWVDKINARLAAIGAHGNSIHFSTSNTAFDGGGYKSFGDSSARLVGGERTKPHASGLSYVPYDDYVANLHRGETVLTRQQAEEYRAGAMGGVETSAILAKLDSVVEAIASMSVTMDGQRVGDVVTARVSRNIAQTARRERRYG